MASPVLGIDLGTTNSVVAVSDGREVKVLEDADGNVLTPSTVSFHPNGEVLIGRAARERRLVDAANTMFSIKRLIGRPFRSPEVRRAQERFPFKFVEGATGGVMVQSRGDAYSLPEISAFVLRRMRAIAERALGQSCVNAVITVPANFNELQRTATRDAGSIAGLNVLRILNEPTAAALAYGVGSRGAKERIAVYDFGGGTFDVSILELAGDVFEVVATAGDTYLGGDDVDTLIADRMVQSFLEQHRLDLSTDRQTYERLRLAAEWVKCQLSMQSNVTAKVEEIAYGPGGAPLSLRFELARPALGQMLQPLVTRTFDICEDAMRIAGVRPTQLDSIVLVGGSTRIPLVRKMVTEYFGKEPLTSVDPDLVVAQGAAIQGFALSGAKPKSPFKSTLRASGATTTTSSATASSTAVTVTTTAPRPDGTQPFSTGKGASPAAAPPPPAAAAPPPAVSAVPTVPSAPSPLRGTRPSGTLPPPAPSKTASLTGMRAVKPSGGTLPPPTPTKAPTITTATATEPPSADDMFEHMATDVTPGFPHDGVMIGGEADTEDGPELELEAVGDDEATSIYPQLPPVGRPSEAWVEPDLLAPRESKDLGALAPRLGKVELKRQAVPSMAPDDDAHLPAFKSEAPPALSRPQVPQSSLPPPVSASVAPPDAETLADVPAPELELQADDDLPDLHVLTAPQKPKAPPPAQSRAPQPAVSKQAPAPERPVPQRVSERPVPQVIDEGPAFNAPLLLDVTPHTLGVETAGGFCEEVIHRNAPIPTEQSRVFSTSQDNQGDVRVRICQGEERKVTDNQELGVLELTGLRPAPRGSVKINVTFILDASGTLSVKAKDMSTGREQQIRINLHGGLSRGEVDRMRERQAALFGGA